MPGCMSFSMKPGTFLFSLIWHTTGAVPNAGGTGDVMSSPLAHAPRNSTEGKKAQAGTRPHALGQSSRSFKLTIYRYACISGPLTSYHANSPS
ncbi:hypothetical protein FKP32DRAFT_1595657 [Trametes sanguinea]|nr:hypothetical protein FKP32DRAFT_1595657 [Trametes sanguinea]